jgi:hypothetical protein
MMNEVGGILVKHNNEKTVEAFAVRQGFHVNNIPSLKQIGKTIIVKCVNIQEWIEAKTRIQESLEVAKYADLESTLPVRDFNNTPDVAKFQNIMADLTLLSFQGDDDENLNLSVISHDSKIKREAQQYCDHDIIINISRTYSENAKLKIIKTYTCEHCGLKITDIVTA